MTLKDNSGPHEHHTPGAEPAKRPDVRQRRVPVYMMHPLGSGNDREANRYLACQWQAAIQAAHPEWLVLAPWIGLSGAWSEERRDEGMAVDYATIDLCEMGVIAGPLDGPSRGNPVRHEADDLVGPLVGPRYEGVSPGMFAELTYYWQQHPQKPIHDLRKDFDIKLPENWLPKRIVPVADFRPKFQKHDQVYVDNKPGGVCIVKMLEERAPGVYYYLIEHATTFWAHEQMLAPMPKP